MEMNEDVIDLRDPKTLRPHEARGHLHLGRRWQENDEALFANIAALGVLQPVLLANDGRVLKGMRRVEGALRAGLQEIPCVRAPAGRELFSLASAAFARAHYTKSAIAYMLWPMLEPMVEEAREYQVACLRQGEIPRQYARTDGKTLGKTEICSLFEISHPDLLEAEKCHKFLAGEASPLEYTRIKGKGNLARAKEAIEKSLFENGKSIRKWQSAAAGVVQTRNDLAEPGEKGVDAEKVLNSAVTFRLRWGNPLIWKSQARESLTQNLREEFRKLPIEAVDGLIEALREVKRDKAEG